MNNITDFDEARIQKFLNDMDKERPGSKQAVLDLLSRLFGTEFVNKVINDKVDQRKD